MAHRRLTQRCVRADERGEVDFRRLTCCRRADDRGEVLPVAILFVGVLLAIMIGVHVVSVAMARTAVQSAADAAVAAAQGAGAGSRVSEGTTAAQQSLRAARSSIFPTRAPLIFVDDGRVSAVAFGGIRTPVLGVVHVRARSCGPLDDVPAKQLIASTDPWSC